MDSSINNTFDFNSLLPRDIPKNNNETKTKTKPFDSKTFLLDWCKNKSSQNDSLYECVCKSKDMDRQRF